MMGLVLPRRARLGLLGVLIAALILLFPLRLAFGIMGLDRYGIAAKHVRGSIWMGRLEGLTVADVPVGSLRASLSPLQLFVGRARVDLWRTTGTALDLRGALSAGVGRIGVDDVTGTFPLGAKMAPIPISSLELKDVSARFSDGACAHAEGHVRALIALQIPGASVAQGLAGNVRCEGRDILLPMASQSGQERLTLRITSAGRYRVDMAVRAADPVTGQFLAGAGFRQVGGVYRLRLDGSL